jgi:hypothetical protein
MIRVFDRRFSFPVAVLAGFALQPVLVSACATTAGPGGTGYTMDQAVGDASVPDGAAAVTPSGDAAVSPGSHNPGSGSADASTDDDSTVVQDAGGPINLPATCAAAVSAYTIASTDLDTSVVPVEVANFWGGTGTPDMRALVTVDSNNKVYAGFTVANGSSFSVVIGAEGGTPADEIKIPDAILGGLAATKDGIGVLLYDPTTVDKRLWAQVKRFGADGKQTFSTDLFRSANLTDDMTKGNPARGRLAYIPGTDQLVAYFGHMQLLQGVRHEGGYLATLSPTGTQTVVSGWFGSHNLDQRIVVDGAQVATFALGDAYPIGFFFTYIQTPNTNVVYRVAAAGDGTANGQVGGMFALSDVNVASFITNRSISPDIDAGMWPNIDMTVADQISAASAAGTDTGFLLIPKTSAPGPVTPVWVDVKPASGATMAYLKAARYGTGDLIFLGWVELTGNMFMPTSNYYTMVVDRTGAVCQPKKQLDAANGFSYDDVVVRPDGAIVWANGQGGHANIVTLKP